MAAMEIEDVIGCFRVKLEGEPIQRLRMSIPLPGGDIAAVWYKPDEVGLQGIMEQAECDRLEDLFQQLLRRADKYEPLDDEGSHP